MSGITKAVSRQWCALDVCKVVFALLLICAHYASERGGFPSVVDLCFSLYILAVPFFFACSGFLFFRRYNDCDSRAQGERLKKYSIRIAKMYAAWSLVYFVFVLLDWAINGTTEQVIFAYFHKCLVFSTYSTIWFLPALVVGVALACFLVKRLGFKQLLMVAFVLYLVGALDKSYSFLLGYCVPLQNCFNAYDAIFLTARNGVFNALPFVILGYWLAVRYEGFADEGPLKSAMLFFATLVLLVAECFVLKFVFHNSDENTTLMLVPCTWFLMKTLLLVEVKQRPIFLTMRKMSTLLFVTQRLYLSAIPAISGGFSYAITCNPYIGLLVVLVATIITSWLIGVLATKSRVFSWLC